jgi:RimJ/RimL family protein N-acetyltransferase
MEIASMAWRTDLALLQYAGSRVDDRGDHLVVRTDANPNYYWGNFLLLERPPTAEEVPDWLERFEQEFPEAGHRTFGVDGRDLGPESLTGFAASGLGTEASVVMTATAVHAPPHPNPLAEVRPLISDADWLQQVELELTDPELEGGRDFVTRRVAAQRSLVEQDRGRWYGAFLDGRLAASLGIFVASEGLARYQGVQTDPRDRGQGLCGTLVHAAARYALDELRVRTLVMVADPDYLAIRIYRSVGFEDTETQLQAERTPRD